LFFFLQENFKEAFMRSLWKGSIVFGLVNIPVKMYTASHEREFKFVMLHKKDMSQIRYARICKTEEKEVPWADIVKGYEYEPGEYVVLDDEDFKKANLTKSKSIEIIDFVKESEIDTFYYSKPYFLEPEKNADRAYALLREALNKSKKVGIAKFVIHNREHIAALKTFENAIVLNELRYSDEIAIPEDLKIPEKVKVAPKELDIALKLIDHLTSKFKPEAYKDTYTDELRAIIKQKAKGKKVHPKGQEPKPSKVQDIMSLLKASLENEPKKKTTKKKKKSA
jgi:DNA end-binding protein Ku